MTRHSKCFTTIVTREMSWRFRTEMVFGLCIWTKQFFILAEWMDIVWGIAPAYLIGALLVFSTTLFFHCYAMTYAGKRFNNSLTHVWRFGCV